MNLLVGVDPRHDPGPALQLAAMLARATDADLVVAVIVARSWVPSMARVDVEWQDYTRSLANATLDRAREELADDVRASYVVHSASSARRGLAELAEQHDSYLIVVGSAREGAEHRTSLGSVTDALLHASTVPVAIAPKGFTASSSARVTRVTAAYGGSEAGADLVVGAATVTAQAGATLRIAAFAVRPSASFVIRARAGGRSEDPIIAEWAGQIRDHASAVLEEVAALPDHPRVADTVIGVGSTWAEALDDVDWIDTDVLVVGSSGLAPAARVFLGSHASKVVRNAPVPVIVVPRRAIG